MDMTANLLTVISYTDIYTLYKSFPKVVFF